MLWTFSTLDEFARLREGVLGELSGVCPGTEATELFVAVNEAVNNALFHGCAGRAGRHVTVKMTGRGGTLVVRVKDGGGGFDFRAAAPAGDELCEAGRGLAIIRRCVDRVEFNEAGNEIVLHKRLK